MEEITTIVLKKSTHSKLIDLGKKSETFDDIINKLLQKYGTKQ